MSTNTEVTGVLRLKGGNEFVRNMNSKLGQVKKQFANLNTLIAGAGITIAAKKMMAASEVQEVAAAKLRNTVRTTGMAAGYTAEELEKMAAAEQKVGIYGDEVVMRGQQVLLTFTKIGKDTFPRAQAAVLDYTAAMEQAGKGQVDMKNAATLVGRALNDPTTGLTMLTRVGITFTEQQKAQIYALHQSGDAAAAQSLILAELEKKYGGMNKTLRGLDSGKAKAFKNDLGDILEVGGELVYAVLTPLMRLLQPLVDFLKNATEGTRNWVAAIVAGGVALKILSGILVGLQVSMGPVGWLVLGITAIVGAFGLFNAATGAATGRLAKFNSKVARLGMMNSRLQLDALTKQLEEVEAAQKNVTYGTDRASAAQTAYQQESNKKQADLLREKIDAVRKHIADLEKEEASSRARRAGEEANAATVKSENAKKLRDNRLAYEYETGKLSLDAYKAYLEQRQATFEMWSDEWLALQKQVDELAAEQLEINLLKQKQIITDADIYKPLQEQQAVSLNVTRDWFAKERAMIHDFVVVVQDIAGGIGQALVQGLQGSMDGWRDVLKNILISVVDMIERYIVLAKIKALVDAVINPWSALKTAAPLIAAMAGLEAVKGAIYAMADGTVVTRPTLALVGEAGPEIVAPKQDFMSYSRQLMEEAAAGRSGGSVTRNEQKLTMNFNSPLTDRRQARRLTDNVMRPAMRRDAKRAGRLQDKS